MSSHRGNMVAGLATLVLGLSPSAWADSYEFKLLHAFHHAPNGADGADPQGPVFVARNGSIFGTTMGGGAYGAGTVFGIDGKTGALRILHTFTGADGLEPDPCLVAGSDGNFYGAVGQQYRSVFRVGVDGSFATVLAYPWDRYNPPPGAVKVAIIEGVDNALYVQTDRIGLAEDWSRSGFGLIVAGAAATQSAFDVATVPGSSADAKTEAAPSSSASPARAGTFSPGVSQCGNAFVAADGIVYRIANRPAPLSAQLAGLGATQSITLATKSPSAESHVSGAGTEVPFVSGPDDVRGTVHWVDAGKPGSAAYWTPDSYFSSQWMIAGRDGRFYALAANSPGQLFLVRATRDGKVAIVLKLPPEVGTGTQSLLWPLAEGADGTLYGVFDAFNGEAGGGVFAIVHHP